MKANPQAATQTTPPDASVHVFRPMAFGAMRHWWFDSEALHWQIGRRAGQVPLAAIATLRLDLSPDGAPRPSRCEIVETSGRRHRISDHHRPGMSRHERRSDSFRALAVPLARRLAQAHPAARLTTGPSRGEWVASVVVAALAVAILLGGAGLMIYHATVAWSALAFMGVLVVYLPMLWPVIRAGGPAPLDPATLPETD